ncbi:MAG: type II toxin-antitoxin system PemK/MazF family toxin [Deltaproteobacteria bacterium]|nr:type II toxin-antitoxin system PemK/MazF family toxin [Deltaproteobacteria bacterium]
MLRRGYLYWGALDKRRPVLVVSSDRFNARSGYVTVVPGTTRLRPLVTHVVLRRGEGGVAHSTMLLGEHVQELHGQDLEPEPLGPPLSRARMREVEAALRLYLDLEQ